MIGIHNRRTDNIISIAISPLYLYENKILENIKKESDTGFFLQPMTLLSKPILRKDFMELFLPTKKPVAGIPKKGL